ncbi:cAMP-regulated phosphoprotein 21, variant 2 [Chamberlinius hualienensis]
MSQRISQMKSHSKVKLLQRSHALRDDASPPPPDYTTAEIIPQVNTLSVTAATIHTTQTKSSSSKLHRLGKQGSSHSTGSLDESSPALSRDSSLELYTDSTGIDLQQFIINTLHKNQKDRLFLFKIELDLSNLVKEYKRQQHKFFPMTAYQRMLVHRVAAFFGFDHNVDSTGTCVIVNKTKNTRIPDMKFRDYVRDELLPEEPKKSILKRDSSSFEDGKDAKSPERQLSTESRRSKSFEEREEEYGKARARIFNQDSSSSQDGAVDSPLSRRSSQEELRWSAQDRPWSSTDSECSNMPSKLVITKTSASTESEPSSSGPSGRELSKESSSEVMSVSSDMLTPKKHIPKASSFGGISVLTRDDSISSTKSSSPRLTKAESFNSTSTAYVPPMTRVVKNNGAPQKLPEAQVAPLKSSVSTCTTSVSVASSSTSPIVVGTPNFSSSTPISFNNRYHALPTQSPTQPVMWISNMDTVLPGSVIINPATGQPYYNPDGTVYRHNPFVTVMQSYPNNSVLQYQLQAVSQSQQSVAVSSHGSAPPAQASVFMCATPQNTIGEQRSFINDNGGMMPNVDMYSRLSSGSLSGTYATQEAQLFGGGDGAVHLQPSTPSNNSYTSQNAYSVPVATIPRPSTLPIPQQTSVGQTMQYISPVSYNGTVPQMASQGGQLTQPLESQPLHHLQIGDINPLSFMNAVGPAQSFQGAQCVQSLTPSIGQPQMPNYVSSYLPLATQSQTPVSNANVPYSAFSAITVAPVVNSSAVPANGTIPAVNPSQSSNFFSGSGSLFSNNGITIPNAGGIQMMVPPPAIPSNYYQAPLTFRPQTPPNNTQRMVGPGQQNQTLMPGINRTYSLTPTSHSSNYTFYTPPVPSTPPQSHSVNQNPVNVHQPIQLSPAQQTQVQYSQFTPPMLTNLHLFRPNVQLMVRPTTPPSTSIIPASGGYTAAVPPATATTRYLHQKGYSVPVVDQRFAKASDFYVFDTAGGNGNGHHKGSHVSTLSTAAINNNNAAIRSATQNCNRSLSLLQGDVRFIGTPLQHHMQNPVRIPMMFSQQRPLTRMQSLQHSVTGGGGRPPRVKRQSRSRGGGNKLDNVTPSSAADHS